MNKIEPFSADADVEYANALADAQRAEARLRDAEQRLRPPPARPRGALATLSTSDAGTLLLTIPPAGLRRGGAGTLMGGAFSVAWFSAIVPATASMLATGGASALFMAPFWLAGGLVAKETIYDPAKRTELSIGDYAWDLSQTIARQAVKKDGGPSDDLEGASVEVAAYVNGIPTYVLRLLTGGGNGNKAYAVGAGLSAEELEWLAGEVNARVDELKARRS